MTKLTGKLSRIVKLNEITQLVITMQDDGLLIREYKNRKSKNQLITYKDLFECVTSINRIIEDSSATKSVTDMAYDDIDRASMYDEV